MRIILSKNLKENLLFIGIMIIFFIISVVIGYIVDMEPLIKSSESDIFLKILNLLIGGIFYVIPSLIVMIVVKYFISYLLDNITIEK